MTTLLSRQFTVDRPLEQAWQHLARAERWPTWAKHIRQVELQPPGKVGPNTTGRLSLSNGVKSQSEQRRQVNVNNDRVQPAAQLEMGWPLPLADRLFRPSL